MITRNELLEMDESRLRREVLIPLFREMGFKDVFEYHGQAMELGKDIVMWNADPAGARLNYVAVVKAKPISGQVGGKGGAGEVGMQVNQTFGSPYLDPQGNERTADRCFVVCPHQIKKEALAALRAGVRDVWSKITILTGDQLWEQIERHLSERALVGKAEELRRQLVDSKIEGARIVINAENVHVQLLHKAPGNVDEIRAVFQFPNDAKGKAALEAMQHHIDTGDRVTIDGEYVAEWNAPNSMAKLFGDERPSRIEIGPSETPEILLNIEVSSHARTVRLENVPFKGQAGRDQLSLRSVQPTLPISVGLIFVRSEKRFNITINTELVGRNVKQQLDGLRVQEALQAGGILRIELATTGQTVAERSFDRGLFGRENLQLLPLAEKVYAIQRATNALLSIPEMLSRDDLQTVELLTKVINGETIERPFESVSVKLTRLGAEGILAQFGLKPSLDLTMTSADEFEMWGVRIPTGEVVRQLKGLTFTPEALRLLAEGLRRDDQSAFDVTFVAGANGATETAYFLKWLPTDEANAWRAALPRASGETPNASVDDGAAT